MGPYRRLRTRSNRSRQTIGRLPEPLTFEHSERAVLTGDEVNCTNDIVVADAGGLLDDFTTAFHAHFERSGIQASYLNAQRRGLKLQTFGNACQRPRAVPGAGRHAGLAFNSGYDGELSSSTSAARSPGAAHGRTNRWIPRRYADRTCRWRSARRPVSGRTAEH